MQRETMIPNPAPTEGAATHAQLEWIQGRGMIYVFKPARARARSESVQTKELESA